MAQGSRIKNRICLDTNILMNLFGSDKPRYTKTHNAIEGMILNSPHSFSITYTQEEELDYKGFGIELCELEDILMDRLSVQSSLSKHYGNYNVVFHDIIYWFNKISEMSKEKKEVRVRRLTPPQFAEGYITEESFDKLDEEDLQIVINAARNQIPVLVSMDADMAALSLIIEARRHIYDKLGVKMPYIVPVNFALCGSDCDHREKYCPELCVSPYEPDPEYPWLEAKNIERVIEDWRPKIFERKPRDKITMHQYEQFPKSIQAQLATQ